MDYTTCPTCEGHGYFYVGNDYYTGEEVHDACSGCDGTGIFLWMMPYSRANKKQHEYVKQIMQNLTPVGAL